MPIDLTSPIRLRLKDPTYTLVKDVPIPVCPENLPFMVVGWDGAGKDPDSWAGRACLCYYVMATSIPNAVEKSGKNLTWKGTKNLLVQPGAGFAVNANYDRQRLNFFFAHDDIRDKTVHAAGSVDVVAHELGHAFLDSLRDDLWSYAVPEIGAFHESFADIHGMTTLMRQDEVLVHALVETQGDLSKTNIISRIGNEMGTLVYKTPVGQTRPLRDATDFFPYADTSSLPVRAVPEALSTEPHSLSRVFTGAAYAILTGVYAKLVSQGVDGLEALRRAGDVLMTYMFKAVQIAPAGKNMFRNVGTAVSFVDHKAGSPYADVINGALSRWGIETFPELTSLAEDGPHTVEKTKNSETVKLSDIGVTAQSENPLQDVHFHVPLDEYRRYDSRGDVVESIVPDKGDTYAEVIRFADQIHSTDRVGEGKEFRVVDNVLVRNRTDCS